MIDYPEDYEPPPEDDVPLFHSRKYKQEQIRWSKISLVAKNFRQRTKPREGISFTELAASLGTPTTLDLEKGKTFVWLVVEISRNPSDEIIDTIWLRFLMGATVSKKVKKGMVF